MKRQRSDSASVSANTLEKRLKLDEEQISDTDEEQLVRCVEEMENKYLLEKRVKLDNTQFSDTDEEQLVNCAEEMENEHFKTTAFMCNICAKKFSTMKKLVRHKLSHMTVYCCDICEKRFNRNENLNRHKKRYHKLPPTTTVSGNEWTPTKKTHVCPHCNKSYQSAQSLKNHRRQKHGEARHKSNFTCKHCLNKFCDYSSLFDHVNSEHPLHQKGGKVPSSFKSISLDEEKVDNETKQQQSVSTNNSHDNQTNSLQEQSQNNGAQGENVNFNEESVSALSDNVQNRLFYPINSSRYDLLTFFSNVKSRVILYLHSRIQRIGSIKYNICVEVEMQRDQADGTSSTAEPYFRGNTYVALNIETFQEHDLNESFQKMFAAMEKYLKMGSGWYLKKVIKLEAHTIVYRPLSGKSFIPLPPSLLKSNCLLNIENEDDRCFLWCILASLHPTDRSRTSVYSYRPYERDLNVKGISFPVTLNQINKFEDLNDNISINVFGYDEKEIIPLRITPHRKRLRHVNLLLLKKGDKTHYCLIINLNRFLSRTKSYNRALHYCHFCLHGFSRKELLDNHVQYCAPNGPQKIELPIKGDDDILRFRDLSKTLKSAFTIYADFECYNTPISLCNPDPNEPSTTPTSKLEVCGFAYKVVCTDSKHTKPTVVFRGENVSEKFLDCLTEEQKQINKILQQIQPMELTKEDELNARNVTTCCLCKKPFTIYDSVYSRPVRHHNHITGRFIGMAHNNCNLNCKQSSHICVIFHNLKKFDAHIICESIGKFKSSGISCIAQTSENYISFSLGQLRFIDSLQFLPSSLQALTENLACDGIEAFPHLMSEFPDKLKAKLLLRKGVFPYEYLDCEEKFQDTSLPCEEAFYSTLTREVISDEDYEHAQNVFQTFNMQSFGDYHDLYVKSDCILLCDVFEAFRNVCMEQYELDPCHFYTSPGLAWSACLKMTNVELELMTDIDQILFIERGIRGGISQISNRYTRANNPLLDDYDPTKPTSYLHYIDANNLYGHAMVQRLPIGSFRFLCEREIDELDILSVPEDADVGYILEASLHYPQELHDSHNDYPLCPEKALIEDFELSPYANKMWRKLHGVNQSDVLPPRPTVPKLICSLYDKRKYVLHYRNLQLYADLGIKIKQIHRVLAFKQSSWMKSYIDFNTEMRKKATSAFQKNFYKLMNVSVFGKTMEDVRKHKNIHLVHTVERLVKLSAKVTFKSTKIFTEDLVAVELLRNKVKLNKPSYTGMCILDLSKITMYSFYYKYLKQKYGDRLQLQFTDTDSLLYYCECEDIYEDIKENLHLFDTSDYPKEHPLHSIQNKKVLGIMSDETNGQPISRFIGLRSKMYCYLCGGKEGKRAKGISKVTVKKDLCFEHYKYTLFRETEMFSTMSAIRSHNHELYTERITKLGLCAFDDKRYLLNAVESLAYGHYKIRQFEQ